MTKLKTTTTTKSVRFRECPSVCVFDNHLSESERGALWHRPEDLRAQTIREVNFYRRAWTSPVVSKSYCWRGLESRLKNSEAQKKKWWTFLKSFLKFQSDLKALDHSDVSNLLMVYASKNSQTDRKAALQVGQKDEAEAFQVYNERSNNKDDVDCGLGMAFSFGLHLSGEKAKRREVGRARSA